jgi:hypothetical protein
MRSPEHHDSVIVVDVLRRWTHSKFGCVIDLHHPLHFGSQFYTGNNQYAAYPVEM